MVRCFYLAVALGTATVALGQQQQQQRQPESESLLDNVDSTAGSESWNGPAQFVSAYYCDRDYLSGGCHRCDDRGNDLCHANNKTQEIFDAGKTTTENQAACNKGCVKTPPPPPPSDGMPPATIVIIAIVALAVLAVSAALIKKQCNKQGGGELNDPIEACEQGVSIFVAVHFDWGLSMPRLFLSRN
jgi:hypothetical protein